MLQLWQFARLFLAAHGMTLRSMDQGWEASGPVAASAAIGLGRPWVIAIALLRSKCKYDIALEGI